MQQGTAIHDKVSLVQKCLSYLRELHLEIWDIIAVFQKEPSFFLIFSHPQTKQSSRWKKATQIQKATINIIKQSQQHTKAIILMKSPKDRHINMQGIAGENTYGSNMINKITQEKVHQRTHARTYFPQQGFFTSNFQEIYMFKCK